MILVLQLTEKCPKIRFGTILCGIKNYEKNILIFFLIWAVKNCFFFLLNRFTGTYLCVLSQINVFLS